MKKNIISLLAAAAILGTFSASAFAATTTAADCNSLTTTLDVQTSANVICKYKSTDNAYGVATGHKSGTKVYESSNALGGIYYDDVGTGNVSAAVVAPTAGLSSVDSATWTEVGK
ncbi:MAG: hypothetical protein GXP60_03550 [Epsilonproteobacteria bacterium]|nr:hypothetical protein [Campylobacterota bacterium]